MKIDWKTEGKTALVLSGGGARGAYQVGVLKAVSDMFPKHSHNPFAIISGTSAGAVNAVALAASANNFRLSVRKVEKIWNELRVNKVYNADALHLAYSVLRLILSLFNEGIGRRKPVALLDNAPLRELLSHVIHFRKLQERINKGYLDAVAVTESSYTSGKSATFFQSNSGIHRWSDHKADGIPAVLSVKHLLASSALPTIFPSEQLGVEHYGDGALRQLSPISSALHMGAERVMVIGVSGRSSQTPAEQFEQHSPSLAKMVGHIFDSAFIDTMENDLNHLVRINELLGIIENENPQSPTADLKKVDLLLIEPSIAFDRIAEKHVADLPRSMRAVLHVTGATAHGGGGELASYLLFEGAFCRELIRAGYQDALEQETVIRQFFGLD